ncbi:MAG: HAMP domain-containing histidine kinase [Flavobacterium sp.]|nr:HAMP domain-containing histidine kinase [Candidatus Neoflavobacterium equi]
MKIKLRNYTLKYLLIGILATIAIWASIFYALLLDEVYDNVDDGLKNRKIQIIREVYKDSDLLKTNSFGINEFRILPIESHEVIETNAFYNKLIYMEYDQDNEPYRILKTAFFDVDKNPYSLEIRTSTVEEDDLMEDLFTALIFLYVFLTISILLISQTIIKRAWKPFYNIIDNFKKYKLGDTTYQNSEDIKIAEFAYLNSEIQEMMHRNEEIYKQQAEFISNASHELQTPLAITVNKLDYILQDEQLTEEQGKEIFEAKTALKRMISLNRSLLMLSKIENNQFPKTQNISINNIVETLAESLEDIIEHKDLTLKVEQKSNFEILINPELAHILVSNLLRNAINYASPQTEIKIVLDQHSIDISNKSKNQEALDTHKIFKRFYKDSENNNSSGLGLSLVQTIIEKTPNLELSYYYKDFSHHFNLSKI